MFILWIDSITITIKCVGIHLYGIMITNKPIESLIANDLQI